MISILQASTGLHFGKYSFHIFHLNGDLRTIRSDKFRESTYWNTILIDVEL